MSEKMFHYTVFTFLTVLGALGVTGLVMTAVSNGQIDYCYVENINGRTGGYEVIGHRPWKTDAHIGVSGSPEGANEIIKNSVSCPK